MGLPVEMVHSNNEYVFSALRVYGKIMHFLHQCHYSVDIMKTKHN